MRSFEVLLSSPAPSDKARLGAHYIATVIIEAKDADLDDKDKKVAQITLRILRAIGDVQNAEGEAMKVSRAEHAR